MKGRISLPVILTVMSLAACSSGGGSGGNNINVTALACSSTSADSSFNGSTVDRIHSEDHTPNTYEQITVRTSVTMDYMVHTPASGSPKALLILIAGGQLNAAIEGTNGTGQQATFAGGNFLVRSAHLFAAQGYKVVTIDRPSDYSVFMGGSTSNSAFDTYRTSTEHSIDLQTIIAAENGSLGLPVAIAGTSRGTISAVAQQGLADYILLSAPVTSGNGSPVGSPGVLPSDLGDKPVHLIWHASDGCFVSTPAAATQLAGEIANVTAVEVTGGINHPELSARANNQECDGSLAFHGFPGIESCVVQNATGWLDQQLNI